MAHRAKPWIWSAGLALVCLWLPASAEEPAKEAQSAKELEQVKRQLERAKSRSSRLESQLGALKSEAASVSDQLIALASRIQSREGMISAGEDRIAELNIEEARLNRQLVERRANLSELLAGLQRLERNPPPPLVTHPRDTVSAVRGAILFGALVPALKVQTTALTQSLARLDSVRGRLIREHHDLRLNLARLDRQREELAALHERKRELLAETGEQLESEQSRARELAERAKSLSSLLAALKEQRKKRAELAKQPRIAFSRAKGRIRFPAQGRRVRGFDQPDGFGGKTKGLFIATRKKAQVTAPADGVVEFAGPFRSYGHILIMDVGEGYHVVLAGLDDVTVKAGQSLRAGEPVGIMGRGLARGTLIGDGLDVSKPILYVEFKHKGKAVNPAPWWVGNRKEARR